MNHRKLFVIDIEVIPNIHSSFILVVIPFIHIINSFIPIMLTKLRYEYVHDYDKLSMLTCKCKPSPVSETDFNELRLDNKHSLISFYFSKYTNLKPAPCCKTVL